MGAKSGPGGFVTRHWETRILSCIPKGHESSQLVAPEQNWKLDTCPECRDVVWMRRVVVVKS